MNAIRGAAFRLPLFLLRRKRKWAQIHKKSVNFPDFLLTLGLFGHMQKR